MATFYYYSRAELHVCNKQLVCSGESFERLVTKGKIGKERNEIIILLCRYRILTLEMAAYILKRKQEEVYQDMDALSEYGLVLKQFYEYKCEDEPERTQTFYCASSVLPGEFSELNRFGFLWEKGLRLEEVMKILSFNQFHVALTENVPQKALQAQVNYDIKGVSVDGRYRLKSRRYERGYSHLMVFAIRDFAAENTKVVDRVKHVCGYYAYREEKMPWFVLICENKVQCAHLQRKLKSDLETREAVVFFLLDTDIELYENPLHTLQTFRYANEEREIVAETYRINDWF